MLDNRNGLDTFAWYLRAIGFLSLAAAGLFIFLKTIPYREYALNGTVLGRYLLMIGIACYFAGRGVSYWRIYQGRKAEREGDDPG